MLNWLKQFDTFCFLDSNNYTNDYSSYEFIIGAGNARNYYSPTHYSLADFQQFLNEKKSWLFGHIGYELLVPDSKSSIKQDLIDFPDIHFFEPNILIKGHKNQIIIAAENPDLVFVEIQKQDEKTYTANHQVTDIKSRLNKETYLSIIKKLQQHIHRGDCYEINFCQEFFSQNSYIDPFLLFDKLNDSFPNPFTGLYRLHDKWLISASPERYLKKVNNTLISQPIKGTLAATINPQDLANSEKDRSENVMVVDLVRNDFSRVCKKGTVVVEELFGIYSYPVLHQMVSTIKGELKPEVDFIKILEATFPMGSMTGAPKIKVMELINKFEASKRGIFSGSIGYISPDGDFDFNVVIRSIMYNSSNKYLSYQAGSGITIYSDPLKEWDECLLKVKAINTVLGVDNSA